MKKIDFDKALDIFFEKFMELNPAETLPEWFKDSTMYGGSIVEGRYWELSFMAHLKSSLGENECWEKDKDGRYRLVSYHPDTGEKRYIISGGGGEAVKLFTLRIDINSGEVSDISQRNFSEIDGDDLLSTN
ncbi:hypothetical protein HCH_03099 [Hahella chejuensis KCTC 2396]|uniref:Uncharacterized protein n=1 Tax=Hahella chejuensis (strain KCTC 2396) TaxID=349521 RepID=Q2SHK9_HAHCH|nr:hypothetical protein [Hahella chejuensis]ABC29865.1 hypothetical protein HCH_03099 [Hahella chejuensis KCTC 2396]